MTGKRVGDFIAERRKIKGITQGELAAKMGVSDKAVSKWERNRSYPDVTTMPKLAGELGVTVDELLKGTRNDILGQRHYTGSRKSMSMKTKIFLGVISFVLVLVIGGIAGYALANAPKVTPASSGPMNTGNDKSGINSFKECADAGYPIQLSYPETCSVPSGKSFTNSN